MISNDSEHQLVEYVRQLNNNINDEDISGTLFSYFLIESLLDFDLKNYKDSLSSSKQKMVEAATILNYFKREIKNLSDSQDYFSTIKNFQENKFPVLDVLIKSSYNKDSELLKTILETLKENSTWSDLLRRKGKFAINNIEDEGKISGDYAILRQNYNTLEKTYRNSKKL